jgi:hypothetical protein
MIKGLPRVRRALNRMVTRPPAPLAFDAVRKDERVSARRSVALPPASREASLMQKRV